MFNQRPRVLLRRRDTGLPGTMIEAKNITKRYGDLTAIERVTFTVAKGEVLAFLGPNGAGKTTTMRILTCFMPATEGAALVADRKSVV